MIAVTGAAGVVGERLLARLLHSEDVHRVVAVDRERPLTEHSKLVVHTGELTSLDLVEAFGGVDTIVHLAFDADPTLPAEVAQRTNVGGSRSVLDAAAACGVRHVVLLSSATVYGAWPNNPVPLSEDALLRPVPAFRFAALKAQIEQLLADWLAANDTVTASLLRPTMVVTDGVPSGLSRTLRPGIVIRSGEEAPPRQYLHLDDLIAAVEMVTIGQIDGIFNVAPDGWISGELARSLAGNAPLPGLPAWLATRVSSIEDRLEHTDDAPGMPPYEIYPWVVANGRLRALGWVPTHSNEEALVVGHAPRRWTTLTAHGKQQLVTAAGVIAAIGLGGVVQSVWRRRSRG